MINADGIHCETALLISLAIIIRLHLTCLPAYLCARMHSCRRCLPVATTFFHGLILFFSVCTLLAAAAVALLYLHAAALCTAALAVLTVVPRCTHSIPGYALELFSLPMSSSLFVLFSLPGLSFIFACLLACIAEGTYAGLYSWVPMVHGPRVLIRRICVNNNTNWCYSSEISGSWKIPA